MIQSAYEYSETLGAPKNHFPQDTSIQNILDDFKRREAFEFDLMELAGRVSKPSTPETELFYQVCYEDIYEQMFGHGETYLPYGELTARLSDKDTQEAYKSVLEQALEVVKSQQAEFVAAREALYRLAMFWYMREN